ncbi:hypothetical protein, partial [Escherichia coli]|uniref:hypothetical protein n=1 Tax=Escherichia coli TaxID=562 RepID=UPI001BA9A717
SATFALSQLLIMGWLMGFEPPTLVPNQLRYQAALLAEILLFEFLVQFFKVVVRGGGLEPPRP